MDVNESITTVREVLKYNNIIKSIIDNKDKSKNAIHLKNTSLFLISLLIFLEFKSLK